MPLATGQVLYNRYRIVKHLKQGGMGSVYRAWDTNLGKAVALKENLSTEAASLQQFEREAQILANLTHPNLARVTDYFVIPGQGQYLVMDFIEGDDLDTVLKAHQAKSAAASPAGLPASDVIPWIRQVCEALTYLHGQNPAIIHRDIKPANIRITPAGQVVLVDFGIAKRYLPGEHTTQGARGVTPGYSPPEQYGQGLTDARTDLYALAATAYHLLTGVHMPSSTDRISQLVPPLPPAGQLNASVSPSISTALDKALSPLMDGRPASAAIFKDMLSSPGYPPPAAIFTQPTVKPAPARSSPAAAIWIGLGVLTVAVFVLAYFLFFRKQPAPNPGATQQIASEIPSAEPGGTGPPGGTGSEQPTDIATEAPLSTDAPTPTLVPVDTPTWTPEPAVMPLPGNGLVQLTFGDASYYRSSLSPDQRRLVAFSSPTGRSPWSLVEIDPVSGGLVQNIQKDGSDWHHPDFSPDGASLLVASTVNGAFKIYQLDSSTGRILAQVTTGAGADMAPAWFPDGQRFAFMSDRDGDNDIYIGSLDNQNIQQITYSSRYDGSPTVSPDGRYIAYYSNRSGAGDIFLFDLQTKTETRLTSSAMREAEPCFSPDGQWIAFERGGGDVYDIWAIRPDGSGERQVTSLDGREQMPTFSPNGLWVIFSRRTTLALYDLYRVPWQ